MKRAFFEIMKRFTKRIICFDIFLRTKLGMRGAALELDVSMARENSPFPRLLKYSV